MPETLNPSGEYNRPPALLELIKIEDAIEKEIGKIDTTGSAFLAKEVLLRQLREKYNWYEKWMSLSHEESISWARYQQNKTGVKFNEKKFSSDIALAEKNREEAQNFFSSKNLNGVLDQVKNDAIESSIKELEEIKNSLTGGNARATARKFLSWIHDFRKEVVYDLLEEEEISYFDEYNETMEAEIDSSDMIHHMLPLYIDKLIEILRKKRVK